MSKYKTMPLPMEEKAKLESEEHYKQWNNGPYNFLLQRTLNYFYLNKPTQRRNSVENQLNLTLPLITDKMLLSLYKHASSKYSQRCLFQYKNTGFQFTQPERDFLNTLETVISNNPQFKYLEIYPSYNHHKDLNHSQKMLIGIHVPDFIVFGLKKDKFSSVVFEIDGDSHIYKHSKDLQKDQNLESLGVLTLPIPNNKVKDHKYLESILNDVYRSRSGALDNQIKFHKRKLWCKTIACNMSLIEIDSFVSFKFNFQTHLYEEAIAFRQLFNCQRKIKKELENL